MKEFIINLLRDNLPEFYFYHNYEHTMYVFDKAIEIGKHEHCTTKELELLETAALWHDTGYVKTYNNHEVVSCAMARQALSGYGYDETDIEVVCGMIMATKIPQSPKNKLEEILADADLEYMGTDSFTEKGNLLFRELQRQIPDFTETKWNLAQISFLQNHQYFTRFCKENREPVKQVHLKELIQGNKQ